MANGDERCVSWLPRNSTSDERRSIHDRIKFLQVSAGSCVGMSRKEAHVWEFFEMPMNQFMSVRVVVRNDLEGWSARGRLSDGGD